MSRVLSAAAWLALCGFLCVAILREVSAAGADPGGAQPSLPPAGPSAGLTWEQVVAEARVQHPELAAAEETVRQAEADRTSAYAVFWPQADADLSAGTSESAGFERDSYSYGVSASQLVFDGFKNIAQAREAVRRVESGRYGYEVVSSNVRFDLRTAFVDALKAGEQMALARKIEARRKQSSELVRLRYEAGREHKGSLLTAEANLAAAVFESAQAERAAESARRRLAVRMGRHNPEGLEVSGDLNGDGTVPESPDLPGLAQKNPLLLQLLILKEAARLGVVSAQGEFWPKAYLNGSVGRSDSLWPPKDSEWSAGASVSMPVFDGWDRAAGLARSESVFRASEAQEKSGRHQITLKLQEAWAAFRDAVENTQVRAKFVEAAEERSRIAEAQYSSGLMGFDAWIIIEDDRVRAQKLLLDARAEAQYAKARWEQAQGRTLDTD